MESSTIPRSEELLGNLIHDLRQPLSNIETGAYLLTLVTPPDYVTAAVAGFVRSKLSPVTHFGPVTSSL